MFGIAIFAHAIRMVLNNLGPALRISGVLMGVLFVATLALGGGQAAVGGDAGVPVFDGGALILLVLSFLVSIWIGVAWHRYILRDEVPTGLVPGFDGAAIGSYFVAGLILVAILLALAIPLGVLVAVLLIPLSAGGDPGLFVALMFGLLLYLPLAYVGYRISPILPSAALGPRMALKDAWYATGTSGAAFVVLTVASVLASMLAQAPIWVLGGFLGAIWLFVVQWATILIGASILTTIYGHYVEGRPLDG